MEFVYYPQIISSGEQTVLYYDERLAIFWSNMLNMFVIKKWFHVINLLFVIFISDVIVQPRFVFSQRNNIEIKFPEKLRSSLRIVTISFQFQTLRALDEYRKVFNLLWIVTWLH
jgi:hypothetical protein